MEPIGKWKHGLQQLRSIEGNPRNFLRVATEREEKAFTSCATQLVSSKWAGAVPSSAKSAPNFCVFFRGAWKSIWGVVDLSF